MFRREETWKGRGDSRDLRSHRRAGSARTRPGGRHPDASSDRRTGREAASRPRHAQDQLLLAQAPPASDRALRGGRPDLRGFGFSGKLPVSEGCNSRTSAADLAKPMTLPDHDTCIFTVRTAARLRPCPGGDRARPRQDTLVLRDASVEQGPRGSLLLPAGLLLGPVSPERRLGLAHRLLLDSPPARDADFRQTARGLIVLDQGLNPETERDLGRRPADFRPRRDLGPAGHRDHGDCLSASGRSRFKDRLHGSVRQRHAAGRGSCLGEFVGRPDAWDISGRASQCTGRRRRRCRGKATIIGTFVGAFLIGGIKNGPIVMGSMSRNG